MDNEDFKFGAFVYVRRNIRKMASRHVDMPFKVGERIEFLGQEQPIVLVIATVDRNGDCQLRRPGPIEHFDGRGTLECERLSGS
jgi:hypothetical protein